MSAFVLDRESHLVSVPGTTTLAELERFLAREGFSLGLALDESAATWSIEVDEFIARGAEGSRDPFRDPADHFVAGFEATLRDGTRLEVKPMPRRSTGPDPFALFFGTRGRFGSLSHVWLRVFPRGVERAESAPFTRPADVPESDVERDLWDALASSVSPAGTAST